MGTRRSSPWRCWNAEAVRRIWLRAFPSSSSWSRWRRGCHQRTDGHPLFLVTLVQAFVERGVLREQDGRWTVQGDIEALALEVPESLRQLLEQQMRACHRRSSGCWRWPK